MAIVHVLEVIERTEQAYGEAAGWLQRIACWALGEQLVDHATWCRWFDLIVYDGQRGQSTVRMELIGAGIFDAFWAARIDGTP